MKKILTALVLAAFVSSCGEKGEDSNRAVNNQVKAKGNKAVQTASYASECTSSTLPDIGALKFPGMRTQYDLSALQVTRKVFYYSDGDCKDEAMIVQEKGKIEVHGDSAGEPGALDEDFNLDETTVTLRSDTLISVFNTFNICGINDWGLNAERKVTEQAAQVTCPGQPKRKALEVVKVEGDDLSLGNNAQNGPAEGRPSKVDTTLKFKKM